jgi:hypothetical protein
MPRPTSKPDKRTPAQAVQPETVSAIWLIKGIALTILAALICGYLTLCLLFYQGQWQFVLHPTRTTTSPSSIAGTPYELIRFAPDESATPQLTGWWISSAPGGRYAQTTILFLGGSDGSLVDSVPTLARIHNLGINIFAIDYRGYGQSTSTRPSQQNMIHDADATWQYLVTSRAIPTQQIIPYGFGVGASLATHLAATHSEIPALILDSPHADLLGLVLRDPRSRFLPVRLLFHEHFPLAEPLSTLHTPKLLLSRSPSSGQSFHTAATPKLTVELSSPSEALYDQSLTRFLDQYLPRTSNLPLVPSQAPAR